MIDFEKLKPVIAGYKVYFPSHWKDEIYKWEAIQHFQMNWDIDAPNFGEMFKQATSKTVNLLSSGYAYPRSMIIAFAQVEDDTVRQMFRDLFDESYDLAERIEGFRAASDTLRAKYDGYGDISWKNHYQNTNSISTYLWLRYPDKYYIYKYDVYKDVAAELNSNYPLKKNGSTGSLINGFRMYDELRSAICKDADITALLHQVMKDTCYPDPQMITATIDVGFYLSRFYLEEKVKQKDDNSWFPEDYNPGISVDDWVTMLNDPSVFTQSALQIMKCMKDYGGQATCKQLSIKYGRHHNFYNLGSSKLAKRVIERIGCSNLPVREDGSAISWTVLYLGKDANADDAGVFIWKLRNELAEALEKVDLSKIPLYADASPEIWKISEGTDSTGISSANKQIFLERHVVVVDGETNAKATSKVSQGEAFKDIIKKDDYFYLCYGNSIRLLGQFTTDNAEVNPEMQGSWYERSYRVIAESRDISAYTGPQKWWTPNDNSTCINIDESEHDQFEELILMPYFGMTVPELFSGVIQEADFPTTPTEDHKQKYTKADFLRKVFMTEERFDLLQSLLRNKKNIILQGAPGVGKTFAAKKLAYAMMGEIDDSRIELIQFHQNYSYEDFIMGYRPDGAEFKLTDGIFYRFCKTAADHPDQEYFFIIDEINRGNLSKIFGELLMLIEKDYRGTTAALAYTGMPFSVPENLYIIGMMNTADRSLAMIDYALRRRFSFFEMEPGFNSDGFRAYQHTFANETFIALIDQIKILNREIAEDPSLGRGFRIGHSYFCGREANECTTDWMRSVVEFDILPTLAEYWFDEPTKLQRWEKNLRGVFDDEG